MKSYIFPIKFSGLNFRKRKEQKKAGKEQEKKMDLSLQQLYRASGSVVTNTDTEYFQ